LKDIAGALYEIKSKYTEALTDGSQPQAVNSYAVQYNHNRLTIVKR